MTTDFRALCAELVQIADALDGKSPSVANQGQSLDGFAALANFRQVAARARAALADEPAVPEGREPASVTGQPSDEAWDALVERAWDKYQTVGYQGERFMYDRDFGNALEFVRQGLARWNNPAPQPPADGEVAELILRVQRLEAMRETEKAALLDAFKQIDDLKHRIDFHYMKIHRLEDALPLPEVDQMTWQPIDTAPRDGTEIQASDYDAIEIVSWVGPRFDLGITGEWTNRQGEAMYPAWWQPLPDHPSLPGQEADR